jgi:type I restriction enzyme R subunit
MPSPEELARAKIDVLLQQFGWVLQSRSTINLSASVGVAIREALLKDRDEVDYLLFVDSKAIGTVEAKPEGYTLTGVEEQSGKYGKGLLDIYPKWREPVPFAYESTGVETQFTNWLDPSPKRFSTCKARSSTASAASASHHPTSLLHAALVFTQGSINARRQAAR